MTYVAISLGAILGANLRYFVAGYVAGRLGSDFPYGTLIINVSGSLLIGIVLTLVADVSVLPWWVRPAFATGFLGAYTTFSTFSYETLGLIQAGSYVAAAINIAGSVGGALIGVSLGTIVSQQL